MATTKKTPAKKPSVKKASAKKPAVKKLTTVRKNAPAVTQHSDLKSFRICKEPRAFTDFQITRQTIYWIILISFIVFAQLSILNIQVEVATLLEAQQSELMNDI